ncbi:MAG: DUF4833 domain-containing protein [bacterium]|nr:DUF4833 domain-containing protein [bacterium]
MNPIFPAAKLIRKIGTLCFLALIIFFGQSFTPVLTDKMPIPTGITNMLFYVQRSLNKNTIIYQLNTNEKNEVDAQEPIRIFWINYEGESDQEPLNTIQKKFAYGLSFTGVDAESKTFCFNFVSYKSQKLYVIQSPIDKVYRTYSIFNNKLLTVKKIFIDIEGGTFWYPRVKYIEVSGRDVKTNVEVVERIIISN